MSTTAPTTVSTTPTTTTAPVTTPAPTKSMTKMARSVAAHEEYGKVSGKKQLEKQPSPPAPKRKSEQIESSSEEESSEDSDDPSTPVPAPAKKKKVEDPTPTTVAKTVNTIAPKKQKSNPVPEDEEDEEEEEEEEDGEEEEPIQPRRHMAKKVGRPDPQPEVENDKKKAKPMTKADKILNIIAQGIPDTVPGFQKMTHLIAREASQTPGSFARWSQAYSDKHGHPLPDGSNFGSNFDSKKEEVMKPLYQIERNGMILVELTTLTKGKFKGLYGAKISFARELAKYILETEKNLDFVAFKQESLKEAYTYHVYTDPKVHSAATIAEDFNGFGEPDSAAWKSSKNPRELFKELSK
jgi:hypothetical protein